MSHFILECFYPKKGYINGSVVFTPPLKDHYVSYSGKAKLPEGISTNVVLESSIRKANFDFFSASSAFFCSSAFKEVIEKHHCDVQFFRAEIFYFNNRRTEKDFWLIHCYNEIDCFDYENSEYGGKQLILKYRGEGISRPVTVIRTLNIRNDLTHGHDYFFMSNTSILTPLITPKLYEDLKKHKLKLVFKSTHYLDSTY